MDEYGALTPAGAYIYETASQKAQDVGFDYRQERTLSGAHVQTRFADGDDA